MTREALRRIVWLVSLALVLVGGTLVLLWKGAEWGIGAAP